MMGLPLDDSLLLSEGNATHPFKFALEDEILSKKKKINREKRRVNNRIPNLLDIVYDIYFMPKVELGSIFQVKGLGSTRMRGEPSVLAKLKAMKSLVLFC